MAGDQSLVMAITLTRNQEPISASMVITAEVKIRTSTCGHAMATTRISNGKKSMLAVASTDLKSVTLQATCSMGETMEQMVRMSTCGKRGATRTCNGELLISDGGYCLVRLFNDFTTSICTRLSIGAISA